MIFAPMIDVEIREEQPADIRAIHRVNAEAFETEDEARLVDQLRDGGFVTLSLVAEMDGEIVGHLLLSPLKIETNDGDVEALALAPMAVTPERQSQGIGSRLVCECLTIARERGHRAIVVLGHPEFYPRFGFSAELAAPLTSPFSGNAWMALELTPAALKGVTGPVVYAEPFGIPVHKRGDHWIRACIRIVVGFS